MADAFIGEIRILPYLFNPAGWLPCDGRQLLITQYQALFSLLSTRFGGNGQTTFNLPNLSGNIPVSFGQGPGRSNYTFAAQVGASTVTLNQTQVPSHNHAMTGRVSTGSPSTTGMTAGPNTAAPLSMLSRAAAANTRLVAAYSNTGSSPPTTTVGLKVSPSGGTPAGGVAPHSNMMPYLVMGYFINWDGIYPSRPN